MFSSPIARKFARIALSSAAVGATAAALLLGAPADASVFARGI